MNIFELFGKVTLKGQDKVQSELDKTEKTAQRLSKGLKIVGAAFTAVGVAGLAMVQKTKKLNAQLSVTGLNLGVTTKEMRDLTLATTNVTFPIKEVIGSFDLLARAGVKDTEVLQKVATAFDTLGDAIGMGATQVTEMMIPAMKTFGLTAEEMATKTDMMTYMARESTLSLEDFNTMVGYTTPELVEQGLTIEELTAALIHMEKQGYAPGRVMTREFMKATTLAQKENISLAEALGLTSKELAGYYEELEGAKGMTQEYADVANEQYTLMDKLRQRWDEMTLGASGFLEPLEPILAAMTAMGPLMLGLSMVSIPRLIAGLSGLAKSFIAVGASAWASVSGLVVAAAAKIWAVGAMLGPIGWGLAIAAVIALGLSIWAIKEKIASFAEEGIAMKPMLATVAEKEPEAILKISTLENLLGGIGGGVTNNFNIAQLVVREEADVPRIARELKELQDRTERRVGLRGG